MKGGGSYIDSPDLIKNKKATLNPIDKKDNKCFQYAVTVVLNHEEIRKDPQRITNIKPFRNKYNWKKIFLSEKNDCKTLEKNNLTIAINVKNTVIFIVRIAFNLLQKITNMNLIKNYVKRKIFVTFQCLLKTLKYQNLINIKNLIKHNLLFMQIFDIS